jgi:hypothetical protein
MSIASILAFVLAGAAKTKSVRVARRSEDKTDPRFIAGYDAGLNDGRLEAKARIAELEDALAVANAQARRDQELIDLWRERALGPTLQAQAQAQMQAAAQMAQYDQQAALNAQNYNAQQYYQQGLLGAQQYQQDLLGAQGLNLIDAKLGCNCVPARHDMFLPRNFLGSQT